MSVSCCHRNFNSFDAYDAHLDDHHFVGSGLREFQTAYSCPFPTSSGLNCTSTLKSKATFRRHLRDLHYNVLVYDESNKTFKFYDQHWRVHVNRNVIEDVRNSFHSFFLFLINNNLILSFVHSEL